MSINVSRPVLTGTKALVVGIANQYSIAYGCAKAFRELGAELAITYVNEKTKTYVEPLAKELGAPIFMPLDVAKPGMLEAVFEKITKEWGKLDILVHSIAWAPKEDSQGPLKTRAASGLKDFDLLLNEAAQRAPIGELVDIMDVGFTCAFLATPYARRLSGATQYVDGGVNIMA